MPTSIANLWVPQIWVQGISEKVRSYPALVSSPVFKRTEEFDSYATGKGETVNLPYFRDITDQADSVQVENTQPTRQVIGSGKQIAVMLNRETANDATALAKQVSGAQPVEEITLQLALRRQKQRQTTAINLLRGAFGFASAPNAATGPLNTVRFDAFSETGAAPPAGQLIDSTKFVNAIALLGELADSVKGGAILMHPTIRAALLNSDAISFEHLSQQEGVVLEMYKGFRVYVSNNLSRAGTTSGTVFDTYVAAPGTVAWGEKAQLGDVVDTASLSYWADKQKNIEELYDRTRFLMHLNGLRWVGTPAAESPTNAELATPGNWTLDYSTADRCGFVCIRTNG
jgi:hypothetical protein